MRIAACVVVVVSLCVAPCVASAESGPASSGTAGSVLLGDPLVSPDSEALLGSQTALEVEEARWGSPEAVVARQASQTAFEGLGSSQALKVDGEAFSGVFGESAGGLPQLPVGERVLGYPSDTVAQVELGDGVHGVVESVNPIAVESSPGVHSPLDLRLASVGNGFAPLRPAVPVVIPKWLGDGVSLSGAGISLTPVDSSGGSLEGGEGVVDGVSVVYANTQTDADTVLKPTAFGFESDTMLRSVESPKELFFRVGLPEGASLVQESGSGVVAVMDAGSAIADVIAPAARDAAGRPVPISMRVAGSTLVLSVSSSVGEYQYPIDVDPAVIDKTYKSLWKGYFENWLFYKGEGPQYVGTTHPEINLEISGTSSGEVNKPEWAYFYYLTKGESQIYSFAAKAVDSAFNNNTNGKLYVYSEKGEEGSPIGLPASGTAEGTVCVLAGCAVPASIESGRAHNGAFFQVSAVGPSSGFHYVMSNFTVGLVQYAAPSAWFDATNASVEGWEVLKGTRIWSSGPNPFYGGGQWVNSETGIVGFEGSDPGVGVDAVAYKSSADAGWGSGSGGYGGKLGLCKGFVQCDKCIGENCPEYNALEESSATLGGMPEGEDPVEMKVLDAFSLSATATGIVKIDNAPPHGFVLEGLPAEVNENERQLKLRATASDGLGITPSSGVASIALSVDGQPVGSPAGQCTPGPCTAASEWTLNTEGYGDGKHTLTVTATDKAGNVSQQEYSFTVHHASPIAMAPGSINPVTGELSLTASDVSIGTSGSALSVSRAYRSRHLSAGNEGPLGPQWTLSVGSQQSIVKEANGNALLRTATGAQTVFPSNGKGGFTLPAGDAGLSLVEKTVKGVAELVLSGSGSITTFTKPSGTTVWMPTITEGEAGTNVETFVYQTAEVAGTKIIEPTEALAPIPVGVSCAPKLERGCRALSFNYATSKTATGEAPSEWGDYTGRLTRVYMTAWEPVKKEMLTTTVAQYAYDANGRLRAEWNPLITPALKSTYGYDVEGHVTATSSPDREPSLLSYGTMQGEAEPGRLLAVSKPSASTALSNSAAPANTILPTLSSASPVIGTTLSVSSNGTWSNSPLAYSYQWEDCASESKPCTAIAGAVNQSYTPQASDAGYTLVAQVTALNADGASTVATAASKPLAVLMPAWAVSFGKEGEGEGQFRGPVADAIDASGNVWVLDYLNDRVEEFSPEGKYIAKYGSKGEGEVQFKQPTAIAISQSTGDVYIADLGNDRIEELGPKGEYITSFGKKGSGPGQLENPAGVTIDPSGNVWVADFGNNRVQEFSPTGIFMTKYGSYGSGAGQFHWPVAIVFTAGNMYVVDQGNNRIEKFSMNGSYISQFGSAGSGEGQFSTPYDIATEPVSGDLYVVDYGNSRVEEFNPAGEYLGSFGSKGTGNGQFSGAERLAVNATGTVYIADTGNDRVQEFTPRYSTSNPLPTPPSTGTNSVATIEYHVPLSGAGLPTLTKAEVETWGQKDTLVEGLAVFPPDKPEGWPAKEYARASIDYLDAQDHLVNTYAPTGAISTTEYNATGDVTKTLSPTNRETALKAGCESKEKCKSAEEAQLLSSESTYNSEGNELVRTLGPQHTVKLPVLGAEVQARQSVRYYYDEHVPAEGGPYHLVTKTASAALVGTEEKESRVTNIAYSGQNNLGWKLHKPTSTTSAPSTLNLTHTVLYEPNTGDVTETRMPAAGAAGEEQGYSFQFAFGKSGTEKEQFKEPQGIAVSPNRNVFVADTANNRVQEFNHEGKYLRQIIGLKTPEGLATDSEGNLWVANTGSNAVYEYSPTGELLTYHAGFTAPQGVAIDAEGDVWVANTGANKIEEFQISKFSEEEEGFWSLIRSFGSAGSEEKQFKEPQGLTIGAEGNIYVADTGNNRIDEYTGKGTLIRTFGSEGTTNGKLKVPHQITVDAAGDIWVADSGNNRIQEFSATGTFMQTFGKEGSTEGKLKAPKGIAIDIEGNAWVADTANSRIQQWTPNGSGYESAGKATAHNTQTIYYIAGDNSKIAACDEHPEWANLPCQTQPATQPTGGLPNIPSTTYTYNYWDEPEKTTLTSGSSTRTTTATYDSAGRPLTSETTATTGTALPKVTNEYNTESGALASQSTTTSGKTTKLSDTFNTLGQITSYTDANENTTTYEYEKEKDDRLLKTNDGKGTQTYSYNETTGELTKLTDSAAGIFTATYNTEGTMTSQGYPNGMSAYYTYNQSGEPTSLEYIKTTHCTSSCTWYTDTIAPTIHSEWAAQASSLSKETYTYDATGRLIQAEETPAATEDCTTRVYAYDADTNRTGLTAYGANESGGCSTKEKVEYAESHTYDQGDRLTDAGASYDAFGDTTAISAVDAAGHELTSTYYSDGQLATQTQNGQTNSYQLDPSHRTNETTTAGTSTVDHYGGPGDSPTWTIEPASGHWTRYIQGIGGGLAAIEKGSETPVLQLADLHGDIIATAALSETESKLVPSPASSEYGVPTTTPGKYDWLGADQRSTELPSGVISMGARSYVPQLGRLLQPDPVEGGSANAYAYTHANPINETDLTGQTTEGTPPEWAIQAGINTENEAIQTRAAEEEAAREEAERKAAEAVAAQAAYYAYWNNYSATLMAMTTTDTAPGTVLWEAQGGGCSGAGACTAGIFGFKAVLGEVAQWWRQVKKGYQLVKETIVEPFVQTFNEQKTVCKAVGYASTAALYFIPDGKLAKVAGTLSGFGTTYAC